MCMGCAPPARPSRWAHHLGTFASSTNACPHSSAWACKAWRWQPCGRTTRARCLHRLGVFCPSAPIRGVPGVSTYCSGRRVRDRLGLLDRLLFRIIVSLLWTARTRSIGVGCMHVADEYVSLAPTAIYFPMNTTTTIGETTQVQTSYAVKQAAWSI
jgi:hypothetical protein